MSVATDVADSLTSDDFASRVRIAAALAQTSNASEAFPPQVVVHIIKEERVAVPIPAMITESDMVDALTRVTCGEEVAPQCLVTRAAPTLGEVRSQQTAIAFTIERNLNESDTRSLGPPQVDSNALASDLATHTGHSGACPPAHYPRLRPDPPSRTDDHI